MTGPAGFFTVLTAGAVSGGVAGAIAGYSAKNSTAVMQSAYNSGLAAGFETGVAMIFTGAGAAVQILVGAGAAATTNVIGQLAHGVSLNQLNYASIGWSALQGGAFAAVGKAAMYAGCKLGITPFCFAPGTLVATENGLKPIQSLTVGEMVWSFDLTSATWKLRPVIYTSEVEHAGDMVRVTVAGEDILATGGHPFWVASGEPLTDRPTPKDIPDPHDGASIDGRWVKAEDLRAGDVLLLKSRLPARIESVQTEPYAAKVYCCIVDDLHCYAVGRQGILVHNGYPPSSLSGATYQQFKNFNRRRARRSIG